MRLAVRSFLSSVRLAVLKNRPSLSTLACHWLPPSSTAAPWVTRCGKASFEKRRPGRSLTGCSDDDDDDDDSNDEEEELRNVSLRAWSSELPPPPRRRLEP